MKELIKHEGVSKTVLKRNNYNKSMDNLNQFKVFLSKKTLIGILVFLGVFCSAANTLRASTNNSVSLWMSTAIQNKEVTLNVANRPIKYILQEINKQTGSDFLLKDDKYIAKELSNLSINVTNATVSETLNKLLVNTSFTHKFDGEVVMILKDPNKKKSPQQPIVKENEVKVFELKGTVISHEDGKPIPGTTIVRNKTNTGAITDVNGEFSLTVSVGDEISISCIGMVAQTLKVQNENPLKVVLADDVMKMDDVVVMGYSSVKRSSYTGNATTVKGDDLMKASKTDVMKALQAFDPSFRILDNNQWGSDPNAVPEVNIRGGSSIGVKQASFNSDGTLADRSDLSKDKLQNNPNLPTFIMDGFEISVSKLYDFDPSRIESVTILKDAAATALYGSRAANGVVVITTVTPKPGKLHVSYNVVGELSVPDLSDYKLLNAAEKLEVERLAGCYTVSADNQDMQSDPFDLMQEYNAKFHNIQRGVDTHWLSKPLKTALNHKHSLYIDGGTNNLRFGMDFQYYAQDGVMKDSQRNRMGAGFYVQYNFKNLSVRNYVSYLGTSSQESPYGNFSDYAKQLPYDTYKEDDGTIKPYLKEWTRASSVRKMNPLFEPSLKNFDKSTNHNLTNNLIVNWHLTDHLLWKAQFSIQKEDSNSKRFYDPRSMKNATPLSETVLSSGELYTNYSENISYSFNTTLSYLRSFKGHDLNALLGYEISERGTDAHNAFYRGFPSGSLSSPNYAQEQVGKTNYSDSKFRQLGLLASLNYTYDNIYLFDMSLRVDGSSAFGSEKRFAPFGSFGVGLNIHNYKFMEDQTLFDQLKIRASYGQVGNVNFSPYEALITYRVLSDDWYKTGYGAALMAFGNPNLKWETTRTLDVGLEVTLLQNLLYMRASYYDKKTVDLINDVTIPVSTGFTSYKDNIGEVSNRGFELDVRIAAIQRSDLSLYITGKLARNRNKILKISESMKEYNKQVQDMYANSDQKFDEVVSVPLMQYQEGGSLTSIWGVQSLGINPVDGSEIFLQRDGKISKTWRAMDQVIIGNTEPKGQGSFGFNLTYKRFSIYTSFMYEFGGQRYNQTLVDKVENVSVYKTNVDRRVLNDRWKEPGDNAKYKALKYGRRQIEMTKPTSRFVQDYNVLSWNSLEISYDLPQSLLSKFNVSMLRLSAGMNDIFHLSSVEQERGLNYPYARTVTFSARLSF